MRFYCPIKFGAATATAAPDSVLACAVVNVPFFGSVFQHVIVSPL